MRHLAVIQVIDYIVGVIYLLLAFLIISFGALGAGAMGFSGQQGAGVAAFFLGTFGMVTGGLFALVGILSIVAANALVKGRLWSKIVHIIVALLWNIWMFPLGTAYAIYCLWALLVSADLKDYFSGGGAPQYAGDLSSSGSHSDSGGFDF